MVIDGTDVILGAAEFVRMVQLTDDYFKLEGKPKTVDDLKHLVFVFDFEDGSLQGLTSMVVEDYEC